MQQVGASGIDLSVKKLASTSIDPKTRLLSTRRRESPTHKPPRAAGPGCIIAISQTQCCLRCNDAGHARTKRRRKPRHSPPSAISETYNPSGLQQHGPITTVSRLLSSSNNAAESTSCDADKQCSVGRDCAPKNTVGAAQSRCRPVADAERCAFISTLSVASTPPFLPR